MSFYIESPFDPIVDVHWKKKKPDGPPDPGLGPPYCGRYGWGSVVAFIDPGTIGSLPYGPNQFIPMVGTFSTVKADRVYGGLSPDGEFMLEPTPTMTATADGLHVQAIYLGSTTMSFSTNQLMFIRDFNGLAGVFSWVVPMAEGQTADGIPMVIKTYTINMEWFSAFAEAEVGLGISHPIPGFSGTVRGPTVPAVILGNSAGGSASYTYDFKYVDWAKGNIRVNEGNQYDPNLGGPALLWWMERRASPTWTVRSQFMSQILFGLDDHYTWEIVAGCQPRPPIFLEEP